MTYFKQGACELVVRTSTRLAADIRQALAKGLGLIVLKDLRGEFGQEKERRALGGMIALPALGGFLIISVGPTIAPPSGQAPECEAHVRAATTAYHEGRYAVAEKLLLRALKDAEEFGADDPHLAFILIDLAVVYHKQGRYSEAEPLYQQGLTILETRVGLEYPPVALTLTDLAALYREQGRYAEAERAYQRGLVILEKIYGEEHPRVGAVLENYTALLPEIDRELETEKIETRRKALGSPRTLK